MTADDLASELLSVLLRAHPLDGSLLGLSEYDERLPDLSEKEQDELATSLRQVASEAARLDVDGSDEVGLQTADLVRCSAEVRAEAAAVPFVEFTVSDFHGAPVTEVLISLPHLPLDNDERADAYLTRLRGIPALLETAAERHLQGAAAGRVPVRRLVEGAIVQLDAFLADPEVGGIRRERTQDASFGERVDRALEEAVRPALARYKDVLESRLLGAGRDDEHCGLSHLPDGERMYAAFARLHTSSGLTPEELHRTGLELVERVDDEYRELGGRLWRTNDLETVLGRLRDDADLRYNDADEILSDARAAVARAEEAAPRWFGELPETSCVVEPVPAIEEAASAPAF